LKVDGAVFNAAWRQARLIHARHILYIKLKLAQFAAVQHNALVSSNFCKELDLARFHQRAFFCPSRRLPLPQAQFEIKLMQ